MRNRLLLAVALAVGGTGCLTNTISGSWTGCAAGDVIYVSIPNSSADDFPCERGGFELDSSTEGDFAIQFTRRDATGHQVSYQEIRVTNVHGDRDVGLIQF